MMEEPFFVNISFRRFSESAVKALSEILRYRDEATREIDSPLAYDLMDKALRTFVRQRDANNGNYIFRHSCLIIVYLLCRRAYDDEFLPPESPFAEHVKTEFRKALD